MLTNIQKCGYCITKLADTKSHLRFGPKPYTRLNSLNALRVQASCSNTSCNLRAFIPAPDLPRCNCTEFLINDIHHETCVSGHFCENCIWTALTHVSMARWFRRSSEELGITFTVSLPSAALKQPQMWTEINYGNI